MKKINLWLLSENVEKVKQWHEQGKSKSDIAGEIGITLKTLNGWCKRYASFAEIFENDAYTKTERQNLSGEITQKINGVFSDVSDEFLSVMKNLKEKMKNGDIADAVEYALIQSALGYDYSEERTEYTEKGDKTVTARKYASPSTTAQMILLKKYKPKIGGEDIEDDMFELKVKIIDSDENGN